MSPQSSIEFLRIIGALISGVILVSCLIGIIILFLTVALKFYIASIVLMRDKYRKFKN